MVIKKDLKKLFIILPNYIKNILLDHQKKNEIIEIILDIGQRPQLRFMESSEYLNTKIVSWQDIDFCTKQISKFNSTNRAGIEKTLHRISCLRNRDGLIIGLTCRIGRTLFGTINILRDLMELNKSILIIGRPGIGKTTIIREIARVLSSEMNKRVVIVDTSNEIGGDSDIPHSGIGNARRMQVPSYKLQHDIMIEAVENHMPEVIMVDEIGTETEVAAAQTISERGVQLIGTAHGRCLENIIKNPTLTNLIGGIQSVILSDEEAKKRGTQKTILERKGLPTFEIIIEINKKNVFTIHQNVNEAVDLLLKNKKFTAETRELLFSNKIIIKHKNITSETKPIVISNFINTSTKLKTKKQLKSKILKINLLNKFENKKIFIYCYAMSFTKIQKIFQTFGLEILSTKNLSKATIVLALKSYIKNNKKLCKIAKSKKIPIYTIKKNNVIEIVKTIKLILNS